MNQFPMTQNGKIDKRALPDPDMTSDLGDNYIAPGNEFERTCGDLAEGCLK
jgi:hypothetical protein